MGKWLVLAAILAPLCAHAAPLLTTSPLPAGPLANDQFRTYVQPAPQTLGGATDGWGFRATLHGRSLDLAHRDLGWAPDSQVQSGDMAAGWGWRGHGAEAMVGYSQYAIGPHFDPRARPRQDFAGAGQPAHTSVLGLSLVLRGP
jgi:hypothetical protein